VGVLLSTLLSLGLMEAALRVVGRPQGQVVGWKVGYKQNSLETNEFGFRGRRAAHPPEATVVLVGDSQVETSRPLDKMPEVYLENALKAMTRRNVRVVSVGAAGWGQDQALLALRQYLPRIKPQAVCLWFTSGNDVWNNTFPTQWDAPKPTFWLENGRLKGPHATWMERYHRRSSHLLRLLDKVRHVPPCVTDAEWESKLPPAYQSSKSQSAPSLVEHLARQRGISAKDVGFEKENFNNERTHYNTLLYPPSPRLRYSAQLTRTLLKEIWKCCQQNDAQFVVFDLQAWDLYGVPEEPTAFDVNGKTVTLSVASARKLVDDIFAGMPTLKVPASPKAQRISKTDLHLNDEGNKYVMEALARWLVSHDDLK
jgi:hypothetical protein